MGDKVFEKYFVHDLPSLISATLFTCYLLITIAIYFVPQVIITAMIVMAACAMYWWTVYLRKTKTEWREKKNA